MNDIIGAIMTEMTSIERYYWNGVSKANQQVAEKFIQDLKTFQMLPKWSGELWQATSYRLTNYNGGKSQRVIQITYNTPYASSIYPTGGVPLGQEVKGFRPNHFSQIIPKAQRRPSGVPEWDIALWNEHGKYYEAMLESGASNAVRARGNIKYNFKYNIKL